MNATVPPPVEAALLDVKAVAALLGCSARHVYRLADASRMPAPVHVGALVRWRRAEAADYPLHVVCTWIGNAARIAQKH